MKSSNPVWLAALSCLAMLCASAPVNAGACCLADGMCVDVPSESVCEMIGGMWQGDASECTSTPPPPCEPFGPCCFADISCELFPEGDCIAAGGRWQGQGASCDPGVCVVTGACCLGDGSCMDLLSQSECVALDGEYYGLFTTCSTTECLGACSFDETPCQDGRTRDECEAAGGNFLGGGSQCADFNTPAIVQCQTYSFAQNQLDPDLPDVTLLFDQFDTMGGTRELTRVVAVMEGAIHARVLLKNLSDDQPIIDPEVENSESLVMEFPALGMDVTVVDFGTPPGPPEVIICGPAILGPGESCDFGSPISLPDALPNPPYDPSWVGVTEEATNLVPFIGGGTVDVDVLGSGVYRFLGQLFSLTQVPHTAEGRVCLLYEYELVPQGGACCIEDMCFDDVLQEDCESKGGVYQGDDVNCTPELCPETKGACCLEDGVCSVITEEECEAANGNYQGDLVDCSPGLCVVTGACCFTDGTCMPDQTQAECVFMGGTYQGNNTKLPGAEGRVLPRRRRLRGADRGGVHGGRRRLPGRHDELHADALRRDRRVLPARRAVPARPDAGDVRRGRRSVPGERHLVQAGSLSAAEGRVLSRRGCVRRDHRRGLRGRGR
jgi:hypothetical protein